MPYHLTITVNFPDGSEVHDIEHLADSFEQIPATVAEAIRPHVDAAGVGYSSLVIVVLPPKAG